MRKIGMAVLGFALGGVLAGGGVALASSAGPHITSAQTIHLLEHDTHQAFVDINHNHRPDPGDSFVFAGTLSNPSTHKVVGSVNGQCTVTAGSSSLCNATGTVNGKGQVEVGGTTGNERHFDIGVLGGTGLYQNARGIIHIDQINDTDSMDTLRLIP